MPTLSSYLLLPCTKAESNLKEVELATYADSGSRRSKKVIIQVIFKESKASMKLKLRRETYSTIYSSEVGTEDGVRPERTRARAFKLGLHQSFLPHSLPILIQREHKSAHSSLMDGVCYK